jgi:hypothetical protein
MNDIVAFKNAGLPVGDLAQFQKALATAQANVAVKDGGDFLKLLKHSGEWAYGATEVEVQPGSHWAINPASLRMGYIAWGDGEVLGKKLLPILTGQMVDQATLPNVGAKWDECISAGSASADCPRSGQHRSRGRTEVRLLQAQNLWPDLESHF